MTIEHICTGRCTGHELTPETLEAARREIFEQRSARSREAAKHSKRAVARSPIATLDPQWARRFQNQLPSSFDTTMPGGPACYMAIDEKDQPLYVGSAGNPVTRIGEHARRAEWYASAVRWRIWPCEDRAAAYALERRLIGFYQPPWNRV